MTDKDLFAYLSDARNEERHRAILRLAERNTDDGSELIEEEWLEQPSPLKVVDSITVYGLNNPTQ